MGQSGFPLRLPSRQSVYTAWLGAEPRGTPRRGASDARVPGRRRACGQTVRRSTHDGKRRGEPNGGGLHAGGIVEGTTRRHGGPLPVDSRAPGAACRTALDVAHRAFTAPSTYCTADNSSSPPIAAPPTIGTVDNSEPRPQGSGAFQNLGRL